MKNAKRVLETRSGKSTLQTTALLLFALVIVVFCVSFFPIAFSKTGKTVKTGNTGKTVTPLELLQQNKSISVSLNTTSTFNNHGKVVTIPAEFSVESIPITWAGLMFSGSVYVDEEGNVAEAVSGFISADGTWIESMTFSKQIVGQSMMGISFEVKLRNIPVIDSTGALVSFNKTGDVQKHVVNITYSQWGIKYVSTDWENINGGQPPTLRLTLEKEAPVRPQRAPPGGMM